MNQTLRMPLFRLTKRFTNTVNIIAVFCGMFLSISPDFRYYRVFKHDRFLQVLLVNIARGS